MFKVTRYKHISTTVAGDFHYKVWIFEARSCGNAQILLLEAVCPMRSTWGHIKKEHRPDTDQKDTLSSKQIKPDQEADQKGPADREGATRTYTVEDTWTSAPGVSSYC
jgi:hypothetical protein